VFEQILVQTVNGLVNGMVLALVASGLTLIFGIMDVVNFAHGDLVMLGGFTGAVTVAHTGNFWLGLLVASVVIGLFGALLQITTLRPLIGRDPLTTIIATFGISLVLQKYALWQFGPTAQNIPQPIAGRFELFYLQYPWYRLGAAVMAGAIIGALYLFLKFGKYGIWIRATTQDRVMAAAMGIELLDRRLAARHPAHHAVLHGRQPRRGVLQRRRIRVPHALLCICDRKPGLQAFGAAAAHHVAPRHHRRKSHLRNRSGQRGHHQAGKGRGGGQTNRSFLLIANRLLPS
jgi:hypothetical protein